MYAFTASPAPTPPLRTVTECRDGYICVCRRASVTLACADGFSCTCEFEQPPLHMQTASVASLCADGLNHICVYERSLFHMQTATASSVHADACGRLRSCLCMQTDSSARVDGLSLSCACGRPLLQTRLPAPYSLPSIKITG